MSTIKANILNDQLALTHKIFNETLDGISTEVAQWQPAGRAHSIAANYAHVIVQEDVIVSVLLKGEQPLFATTFANVTGLSELPPLPETELVNWHDWGSHLVINLDQMKAYREAVYANTNAYLKSVSDDDLGQNIDTGFLGTMTKFDLVNLAVLNNCNWHIGEISAVKGLQGLMGYPF